MSDALEDVYTRHLVYLQRLVPQLGKEQIGIINSNNRELKLELDEWLEKNQAYNLTQAQLQQIQVLRNKVDKLRGGAINQAHDKYQGDMVNLAGQEQNWVSNGVKSVGGPSMTTSSVGAIAKMVERQPFAGATISQMYNKLAVDDANRIVSTVQQGLSEGLTRPQITRQVFGSARLGYIDGVMQVTNNAVNNPNTNSGITRTTVNGVHNESKKMLYEANSDIIDAYKYLATLDGRTSLICASRDGNIYEIGKEPPLPAHINCRSMYVPFIKGMDIESTRPSVSDTRTRKEREKDFRKEAKERNVKISTVRNEWKEKNVSRVSSKKDFGSWLKGESKEFQDEYLGKTKAELFRKGKLPISRFVDPMGTKYTIDELYKLDKDAFKKAGLDKPK